MSLSQEFDMMLSGIVAFTEYGVTVTGAGERRMELNLTCGGSYYECSDGQVQQ